MNNSELKRFAEGPKERRTQVVANDGTKGTLTCKRPGVWVLNAENSGRCRWGNKAEIHEDLEHFKAYGKLPHSKTAGWA